MKKIKVNASREYEVVMSRGVLPMAGMYIRDALRLHDDPLTGTLKDKKICIVTDAIVDPLYGEPEQDLWTSLTAAGFEVSKFVFPGGEENKSLKTVSDLLEFLAAGKFTRSDVLLALGGGIVGDVTGFAAATYLRGIEYVQVPTSLLAIVDSSVGGKTGVNLEAGKNLAGAFWQPSLVLFDPAVLSTLSYDLKLDGIAEAIKAGVIAQPLILESIRSKRSLDDAEFLTDLAYLAIEVKRRVVEEDERDTGSRQLLNFGHTIAHAIEKCSLYQIRHGHAVAIGMAVVSVAADRMDWSVEKCSEEIIDMLRRFKFPLECPFTAQDLARAAMQDKKIRGGDITLVVPTAIGRCRLKTIPTAELENFISCGLEG